jgi:hypothetical protein
MTVLQSTVRIKLIARSRIQCEHPERTNANEQNLYEFVRPVVSSMNSHRMHWYAHYMNLVNKNA